MNQQLNYQARLLDSTGAVVPDGNYNIRFKVYQDGTGTATGNPGGTLKWTEIWQNSNSQGVQVKNGYLSVQLGTYCGLTTAGSCQGTTNAGVDFNQDTLWLSIDVGGTSTGASPTYDGEMLPMRRLGAAPYAINSYQLGGLTAGQFLQMAPSGTQADSSANSSININKTNASGNLLELQRAGVDVATVGNDGTLTISNTGNQQVFRVGTSAAEGNIGDLITNASFENNSTTGWTATTGCTLSATTSETQFGTYSGQCTNTATAGAGFKYVTGALTANTNYVFTFYAKASRLGGNVLNFGHVENGGGEDTSSLSLTSQTVLNNGWTRYTLSFKTGATLTANDYLYIKQNDATLRNLFVDGVTLQTDTDSDGAYREGEIYLNGTINSNMVLQGPNSSNAFQVLNSLGTAVFTVDTTDSGLVNNGGFESNQQGWTAKGSATIARDSSQRKSGYASLRISSTATASDGAQFTSLPSGMTTGTYSITFAAKSSGGAFAAGALVAGFTNSGGDTNCTLSPSVTTAVPNAFGWTTFTCTVAVATTAPTAFYIKQTDTSTHTYWIDAVEVVLGSTVSPYGAGNLMLNGVIRTPVTIQNQSDNTGVLSVTATDNLAHLTVDTLNQAVFIGSAVPDTRIVLTVLDTKSSSGDPGNAYNGAMYYNSNTNTFRCYQNNTWVSCIGSMRFANTSVPSAITSTADTNFGTSYTIPANDCVPGRVYRVTAYGTYTNSTTALNTILKVKFGNTVLGTTQATGLATSTTRGWQVEFQIICITAGAAGTVEAQGRLSLSTSNTASNVSEMPNTSVVGSINTTTTQQIQMSAAVSATTGAPSVTLRQFVVEAMGP